MADPQQTVGDDPPPVSPPADHPPQTRPSSHPGELTSPVSPPAGSAVETALVLGATLGPYRLLAKLGEGGMGAVYKAQHEHLDMTVAVKVLPQHITRHPDAVARFKREMKAVGKLKHPNIVQAHDAGEISGTHYLAMEFVEGDDLLQRVKDHGPLSVAQACDAIRQAALALDAAHAVGLIHRDIKPANLLLAKSGQIKLLDLGLALLGNEAPDRTELTTAGQTFGTPDYMAPEQWEDAHAADARTDLYALGCTLFYLLAGHAPYGTEKYRTSLGKMKAHALEPIPEFPVTRSDIPPGVTAIYRKLLAKTPPDRYQTAAELAQALTLFSSGRRHEAGDLRTDRSPNVADAASVRDQASGGRKPPDSPTASHNQSNGLGGRLETRDWSPDSSPNVADAASVRDQASGGRKPPDSPDAPTVSGTALAAGSSSTGSSGNTAPVASAIPLTININTDEHQPRKPPRGPARRLQLAAGAITFLVLCGVIIIKITNPDGTQTTIEVPETSKVEISHRMGTPARPNKDTKTQTSKGTHPTDADRTAAEWAFSQKGEMTYVCIENIHDGTRQTIYQLAGLPKEPFRLIDIGIGGAERLEAAALEKQIAHLKSLLMVFIVRCPQVGDELIPILQQIPSVIACRVEGSGVTSQGLIRLLSLRPMQILGIDGRQFTPELAGVVSKTPSLRNLTVLNISDTQLRQCLRLKRLQSLSLASDLGSSNDLRHSTWVGLSEELPQLQNVILDNIHFSDANLAALARLPNLESLGLNRLSNISDAGLAVLLAQSQLKNLDIRACAVTPLGLSDFLDSKPECQVIWDGTDHRAVAEWVWSVGGKVQVAGRGAEWLGGPGSPDPKTPRQEGRAITDPATNPAAPEAPKPGEPISAVARASQPARQPGKAVLRPAPGPAGQAAHDPAGGPEGVKPVAPDARPAFLSRSDRATFLTGVDLSGLQTLKDADLARLADCTTLRDLQLHNSSLTGACLTHLLGSQSRKTSDTPPKDEPTPKAELSQVRLPRLRGLSLAGLPIADQDLTQLGELKQLQFLFLDRTKITDAGMPSLSGLRELQILNLNGTAVTTAGLDSLKRLPNLESLNISNSSADDRTAEMLCEFPSLRTVGLDGTRLTDAGVKRLAQRALPWFRLYLSNIPAVTDAILTDLRGQRELISLGLNGTSVTPTAFEMFVREHPRLGMTLAVADAASVGVKNLPKQTTDAGSVGHDPPDLRVARRVLAAGGEVIVQIVARQPTSPLIADVTFDAGRVVRRIEDLPKDPFRINLINLRPAGAKVTNETLTEVGRLEMLEYFQTADAMISDVIVGEIAAAPKLVELHLNGTPLSSATVRQLSLKVDLTFLYLDNTSLDATTAASLATLRKLKHLGIGANQLTDDDIAFIEKLTEIETLHIGGTHIVNRGWESLAKLPKLKVIRAYNMLVTDEALGHAGQIESLEYLAVGSSEVGDPGLLHLRSLRHLRELQISYCHNVTDAGLEALADLPALETLHLNNTPITDAGLKHLAKIKTLKSLNLAECKLSATALDDLQDALPWCRIERPKSP